MNIKKALFFLFLSMFSITATHSALRHSQAVPPTILPHAFEQQTLASLSANLAWDNVLYSMKCINMQNLENIVQYTKKILAVIPREIRSKILNKKNTIGQTALMIAIEKSYIPIVHLLLQDEDIDLNSQDHLERTALMYAARIGSCKLISLLIDSGALIDFRSNRGDTALRIALLNGNTGAIEILLEKGASSNINDAKGNTAMINCLTSKFLEGQKLQYVVTLLMNYYSNVSVSNLHGDTSLMLACKKGNVDVVSQLLFSDLSNINHQNKAGYTALMYAAKSNNPSIVRLLIDSGAHLDLETKGKHPMKAIHMSRNSEVFQILNKT